MKNDNQYLSSYILKIFQLKVWFFRCRYAYFEVQVIFGSIAQNFTKKLSENWLSKLQHNCIGGSVIFVQKFVQE